MTNSTHLNTIRSITVGNQLLEITSVKQVVVLENTEVTLFKKEMDQQGFFANA